MRLKAIFLAAILTTALPWATAQQPTPDEAAIRSVLAHEAEGWNKFDPHEVASVFTADAIWQNPFGVRLHGRAEIEKFLTDLLARPGYRAGTSTVPTKILDLRLTSPTTAAVWSDEKIEGLVNDISGNPMQPRHSYYLNVMVKQNGEWKISDAIIMDIVHLK
ncbi:YybH family protein [Granulicella tundricola]|uniref:YybH family protein n=1 Tax=Granulicella tundricola TaxID=940615 RepID=UPI0003078DCF|nr:SgcJ/EcaC family oxidoreductase [Granulicella tundricola]